MLFSCLVLFLGGCLYLYVLFDLGSILFLFMSIFVSFVICFIWVKIIPHNEYKFFGARARLGPARRATKGWPGPPGPGPGVRRPSEAGHRARTGGNMFQFVFVGICYLLFFNQNMCFV